MTMMQKEFDANLYRLTEPRTQSCRVLLAVSGGIDSMTMAHLFLNSSLKIPFAVAHMNFSLRDESSDGDELHVKKWCEDHAVPFFSKKVDTLTYAKEHSISTQMAARDLRYGWFDELISQHGFDFLAIAHNANDNVETFFLNLMRGTGLRGLSGIRETNGYIIRPLMVFTRARITDFATKEGIVHREDATNSESHYMRNRIRNEVFPHFSMINPSFLTTITNEMHRFSDVSEIMEDLFRSKEGVLYRKQGEVLLVDIQQLNSERFRSYWLFRILDGYGFNESQISDIEASLTAQSGKVFNSAAYVLVRDRDYLKLYPSADDMENEVRLKVRKFAKPDDFNAKEAPEGVLYVDAAKLPSHVSARHPKAGDRFKPFGMKGFKLLSDYFTDLKLDVEQKKREVVVVVTDKNGAEQIVAIAGRRIDDRFKVTEKTRTILQFSL